MSSPCVLVVGSPEFLFCICPPPRLFPFSGCLFSDVVIHREPEDVARRIDRSITSDLLRRRRRRPPFAPEGGGSLEGVWPWRGRVVSWCVYFDDGLSLFPRLFLFLLLLFFWSDLDCTGTLSNTVVVLMTCGRRCVCERAHDTCGGWGGGRCCSSEFQHWLNRIHHGSRPRPGLT